MGRWGGGVTNKCQVKSLSSIVHPHRLMSLNHLHIIENSLPLLVPLKLKHCTNVSISLCDPQLWIKGKILANET